MSAVLSGVSRLRFGAFELDLKTGELRKGGTLLDLPPQPFRILALLASHAGELVTRKEIRQQIWGSETFVDFEQGLNFAINKVRGTLGDDAEAPRYIETLPRRGYRFIASVEPVGAGPSLVGQEAPQAGPPQQPTLEERSQKASVTQINAAEPLTSEAVSKQAVLERPSIGVQGMVRGGVPRKLLGMLAMLIAVGAAGWLIWNRARTQTSLGPGHIHSLAVLPLDNLSGNKDQEYFADGVTDELTTNLAKIGSLRVISRTTMMQYRGTHKPVPQIGQELHVDAVVEGSVVLAGSKVRITAQLIDARRDQHLWAQSYEREISEVLEVQDSVALDIASQVKAELSSEQHESLARHRLVKPDAYEAYLHGRNKLGKQARDPIKDSIQDFQRAIDLDPLYAPAYSGLADSYSLLANYQVLSPQEAFPRAKAAALKALSLDPLLAEAHASLGLVKHHYDWDWAGAEHEYTRAIELSPSYAIAHLRYAGLLSTIGRHDEAIAEIERAQEFDPLSLVITSNVGHILFYARRYDLAIEQFRKTLELDPDRVYARLFLGMSYDQKGMYAQSIEELEKVKTHFHGTPSFALAHVYAVSGHKTKALQIANQFEKEGSDTDWFFISGVFAALGNKDRAFSCLEKAYQKHDFFLPLINIDPWMDSLRSDARFESLLQRLGLAAPRRQAAWETIDSVAKQLAEARSKRHGDPADVAAVRAFLYATEGQPRKAQREIQMRPASGRTAIIFMTPLASWPRHAPR